MKKQEIREKISTLEKIAGEIYRAGQGQKEIEKEMTKASDKIEKAIDLLESVFNHLEWLEK